MKVEFNENIREDIRALFSSTINLLDEIEVVGSNKFDNITICVTADDDFLCEIIFGQLIRISQKTIDIIRALDMAHLTFYDIFCKGVKPDGQYIKLEDSKWDFSKKMLSWGVDNLKENSAGGCPDFKSKNESDDFIQAFKYSLLFFISHELFHSVNNGKFEEPIVEERQCDYDATMFLMNALNDKDYLLRAKGVTLGLMLLNVYGIHSNDFDGYKHPFTYDRIINNLSLIFGPENDKIWGFVVALFALHLTEKGIKQPTKEFENFYECMIGYKEILENSIK
jgi:hypothetical protein